MPTLTIFAGVNGVGKTSLFRQQLLIDKNLGQCRINPDEILQKFGGNWRSLEDQYKSGVIALKQFNSFLRQSVSFNWETTTLSNKIKYIKMAKTLKYKIVLYYINVEDVSIALDRIKIRVEKGGHDIDSKLVRNRYDQQFSKLNEVLKYVDTAVFFDNSKTLNVVATYVDKHFTYIDDKTKWTQQLFEAEKSMN